MSKKWTEKELTGLLEFRLEILDVQIDLIRKTINQTIENCIELDKVPQRVSQIALTQIVSVLATVGGNLEAWPSLRERLVIAPPQ